jgi:hypothetical protein
MCDSGSMKDSNRRKGLKLSDNMSVQIENANALLQSNSGKKSVACILFRGVRLVEGFSMKQFSLTVRSS